MRGVAAGWSPGHPAALAMNRIDEIIEHEQAAEKCDAAIEDARREADAHRWEAARLIFEEVAYRGHGGIASVARAIGKTEPHVRKMKLCAEMQSTLKCGSFNSAYNSVEKLAAEKNVNRKPRKPRQPKQADEELVSAVTDEFKKGTIPRAAIGKQLGLEHDSLPLTSAYAVAAERLLQAGVPAPKARPTWNGITPATRQRQIRDLKHQLPGLAKLLHDLARMCSILEDIHVEDFDLAGLTPWDISMVYDDLISLNEWTDRTQSAVQGWLEDGDVRKKIAILKDPSGRTTEEAATALRLAERLEFKLSARLT